LLYLESGLDSDIMNTGFDDLEAMVAHARRREQKRKMRTVRSKKKDDASGANERKL
jgi:hypothetical protein